MIIKLLSILIFHSSLLMAWTGTITPHSPIQAVHINELRNVTNLKRECYGLPPINWTDGTIESGRTKIKSTHISEIRLAINSLFTSCTAGLCTGGSGVFSAANAVWNGSVMKDAPISAAHLNQIRTVLDAVTCTPYTYNWLAGGFGSCVGGSGTWSYGGWSGCYGGYGDWSYGGWGGCSTACGDGVQYRATACYPVGNTGTMSRSASCNFSTNSGTSTRSVLCQRSDALIVADSFCHTAKPATTQACTPSNSAVCGSMAATSQSCTPASAGCGGTPYTSQYCNNGPCCSSANESMNMCPGQIFTAQAAGTWSSPAAMMVLAINANAACNTFSPGRCQNGSATVTFITPCTVCMIQTVTCSCN